MMKHKLYVFAAYILAGISDENPWTWARTSM